MAPLEPPHSHAASAAAGWIELGNTAEARAELNRIPKELQVHQDVLDLCWTIAAVEQHWDEGVGYAEEMVRRYPESESGWIHRAYALRRATGGGLQKAWDALRPACDLFPTVAIIPYNLACYAAQFEQLDEAWEWLQRAMSISEDARVIRFMALADDDLKGLWPRIRQSDQ